jgi:hypothetical protein
LEDFSLEFPEGFNSALGDTAEKPDETENGIKEPGVLPDINVGEPGTDGIQNENKELGGEVPEATPGNPEQNKTGETPLRRSESKILNYLGNLASDSKKNVVLQNNEIRNAIAEILGVKGERTSQSIEKRLNEFFNAQKQHETTADGQVFDDENFLESLMKKNQSGGLDGNELYEALLKVNGPLTEKVRAGIDAQKNKELTVAAPTTKENYINANVERVFQELKKKHNDTFSDRSLRNGAIRFLEKEYDEKYPEQAQDNMPPEQTEGTEKSEQQRMLESLAARADLLDSGVGLRDRSASNDEKKEPEKPEPAGEEPPNLGGEKKSGSSILDYLSKLMNEENPLVAFKNEAMFNAVANILGVKGDLTVENVRHRIGEYESAIANGGKTPDGQTFEDTDFLKKLIQYNSDPKREAGMLDGMEIYKNLLGINPAARVRAFNEIDAEKTAEKTDEKTGPEVVPGGTPPHPPENSIEDQIQKRAMERMEKEWPHQISYINVEGVGRAAYNKIYNEERAKVLDAIAEKQVNEFLDRPEGAELIAQQGSDMNGREKAYKELFGKIRGELDKGVPQRGVQAEQGKTADYKGLALDVVKSIGKMAITIGAFSAVMVPAMSAVVGLAAGAGLLTAGGIMLGPVAVPMAIVGALTGGVIGVGFSALKRGVKAISDYGAFKVKYPNAGVIDFLKNKEEGLFNTFKGFPKEAATSLVKGLGIGALLTVPGGKYVYGAYTAYKGWGQGAAMADNRNVTNPIARFIAKLTMAGAGAGAAVVISKAVGKIMSGIQGGVENADDPTQDQDTKEIPTEPKAGRGFVNDRQLEGQLEGNDPAVIPPGGSSPSAPEIPGTGGSPSADPELTAPESGANPPAVTPPGGSPELPGTGDDPGEVGGVNPPVRTVLQDTQLDDNGVAYRIVKGQPGDGYFDKAGWHKGADDVWEQASEGEIGYDADNYRAQVDAISKATSESPAPTISGVASPTTAEIPDATSAVGSPTTAEIPGDSAVNPSIAPASSGGVSPTTAENSGDSAVRTITPEQAAALLANQSEETPTNTSGDATSLDTVPGQEEPEPAPESRPEPRTEVTLTKGLRDGRNIPADKAAAEFGKRYGIDAKDIREVEGAASADGTKSTYEFKGENGEYTRVEITSDPKGNFRSSSSFSPSDNRIITQALNNGDRLDHAVINELKNTGNGRSYVLADRIVGTDNYVMTDAQGGKYLFTIKMTNGNDGVPNYGDSGRLSFERTLVEPTKAPEIESNR